MPDVFLGLGSNNNPEKMLCLARKALQEVFTDFQVSPVYRNKAIGFEGPDFFNCVSFFTTEKPFEETVSLIRDIQTTLEQRWNKHVGIARSIDLDLLIYGDLVTNELDIDLPRKDITEYAFVLKPLVDLAPHYLHPVLQVSFQTLWEHFPKAEHPLTYIDFNWE
jgi:2-amino-4-hydroxy-6-hydroxymethyldihydropteridine diphosphokinase